MAGNKADAKAKLTAAFQQVDRDHNGQIDGTELEAVLATYYKSAGKPVDAAKMKTESAVCDCLCVFLNRDFLSSKKKIHVCCCFLFS